MAEVRLRRSIFLSAGVLVLLADLFHSMLSGEIRVTKLGLTVELEMRSLGRIRGTPFHILRVALDASGPNYWNNVDVKSAVIVDVGGYIGDTALLFASRGALRIYVFEPSMAYFTMAMSNLRSHTNIFVYNEAIGPREGIASLAGRLMGKTLSKGGREIVRVRNFADVINEISDYEASIDIVKLDVEGSEQDIIRGTDSRAFDAIRSFWIEMHGSEVQWDSLTKYLGSLGYTLVRKNPHYYLRKGCRDRSRARNHSRTRTILEILALKLGPTFHHQI